MSKAYEYVSARKGHLVTRYGTSSYIGARLTRPGDIDWVEGEVVAIPLDEWNSYIREYSRLLNGGVLVRRTAEDHKAWQDEEAQRTKTELDEKAAEDKRAAEEEKKAADAREQEAQARQEKAVAELKSSKASASTKKQSKE